MRNLVLCEFNGHRDYKKFMLVDTSCIGSYNIAPNLKGTHIKSSRDYITATTNSGVVTIDPGSNHNALTVNFRSTLKEMYSSTSDRRDHLNRALHRLVKLVPAAWPELDP
jgi:hypothetical protein